MKNEEAKEKVLKAISIGLAAFIVSSAPMTALAETDDNYQETEILVSDGEEQSNLFSQEENQQVVKNAILNAQNQLAAEVEAAKYAFSFAESVVGEKKWDYGRALYAYEKAQGNYKEYKKKNWWKAWNWKSSEEYEAYVAAINAYEEAEKSLNESQDAMNKAKKAYDSLSKMC